MLVEYWLVGGTSMGEGLVLLVGGASIGWWGGAGIGWWEGLVLVDILVGGRG